MKICKHGLVNIHTLYKIVGFSNIPKTKYISDLQRERYEKLLKIGKMWMMEIKTYFIFLTITIISWLNINIKNVKRPIVIHIYSFTYICRVSLNKDIFHPHFDTTNHI